MSELRSLSVAEKDLDVFVARVARTIGNIRSQGGELVDIKFSGVHDRPSHSSHQCRALILYELSHGSSHSHGES